MAHENVREKVWSVLSDLTETSLEEITSGKNLIDDLHIDSLALLDTLFHLDKSFGIMINMIREEPFLTVKDLEDAVIEELSKQK